MTKDLTFPIVITKTKDKHEPYFVFIPFVQQCTEGSTLNNAVLMAKDCAKTALRNNIRGSINNKMIIKPSGKHILKHITITLKKKEGGQMTYGDAMNAMMKGYKVTHGSWKGYWFLPKVVSFRTADGRSGKLTPAPALAKLRTGEVSLATAYERDKQAKDWRIVK